MFDSISILSDLTVVILNKAKTHISVNYVLQRVPKDSQTIVHYKSLFLEFKI